MSSPTCAKPRSRRSWAVWGGLFALIFAISGIAALTIASAVADDGGAEATPKNVTGVAIAGDPNSAEACVARLSQGPTVDAEGKIGVFDQGLGTPTQIPVKDYCDKLVAAQSTVKPGQFPSFYVSNGEVVADYEHPVK